MEIYNEKSPTPFELQRQKNLIKNYEYMISIGIPGAPKKMHQL